MSEVQVRMYRNLLGDCFLLRFPGKAGPVHMLIDCGVLRGTENGEVRIRKALIDIADTAKRIDVLVVTHEHWDHVSGFHEAPSVFGAKQVTIGAVWLAWTERRGNPLGDQLREEREKAKAALKKAKQKLKAAGSKTAQGLEALGLFDGELGAAGRKTTATAMAWAHASGTPVYLEPGKEPLVIPGVEGVLVYVLGPPQNRRWLKKSNPSRKTPEVYQLASGQSLGFVDALSETGDLSRPFDQSFEFEVRSAAGRRWLKAYSDRSGKWRQIEHDWLESSETLALQLDSDTNNTSLVLAIELVESKRVLLFPGDAQVGNWLSWEENEWTVPDETLGRKTVKARGLLERTVLYKVSHHASHNATLREKGLEAMNSPELVAMIPVDQNRAKELEWEMPFGPLLERLRQQARGRVIVGDETLSPTPPETSSAQEWAAFRSKVTESDLFVEYRISMSP